jgi:hypothetical protein
VAAVDGISQRRAAGLIRRSHDNFAGREITAGLLGVFRLGGGAIACAYAKSNN